MARQRIADGGASLAEVQVEAEILQAEAVEQIAQQQSLIGRRSLVRTPRPGSHDQMPSLEAMAQRTIRAHEGDLSCGEDAPTSLPPEVLAPVPGLVAPGGGEVPTEIGGNDQGVQIAPSAQRLETAGGKPVATAVVRLHNRARSKTEVIRSIEVVSPPRSQERLFPVGTCFTELAGRALFDLFGLPTESGRVYHITVTEHSSSAPAPRPNPHVPGSVL